MFFHYSSLLFALIPYVPSLLFHILKWFLLFLASCLLLNAVRFFDAAPRLQPLGAAFRRFCRRALPRPAPLSFSSLRPARLDIRAWPSSPRPTTCALFFLLTFVFFLSTYVQSAQVTLQWDPSPEATVAGYRVYYGTASGQYQYFSDVGKTTLCTVSGLQDGVPYYFAATAYDSAYAESGYSAEITYGGGQACSYSLSTASQSFSAAGGTGAISLSTDPACSWTAVSNAAWIVLSSNSSRSGSGTVTYSVASNSSPSSRSGTLAIAGNLLSITQQAAPQYQLAVNKTGTGSGTVSVSPAGTLFSPGTGVTLSAVPDGSSAFAGWSGGCTGTSPTCTLTMTSNLTATAVFNLNALTIAVNAGGDEYTDRAGTRYQADRYFSGGNVNFIEAPVLGAADPILYQSERYGRFSYSLPVPAGSYDVTLRFVENTYTGRNQRVFDVLAEGRVILSALDIYAVSGMNAALDFTFTVTVADGMLDLGFLPRSGEAQVSAILVRTASGPHKNPPGKVKRFFTTQAKTD